MEAAVGQEKIRLLVDREQGLKLFDRRKECSVGKAREGSVAAPATSTPAREAKSTNARELGGSEKKQRRT